MYRTPRELLQFARLRRPEDIHTGADVSFRGLPTGAALFCNLQINVFCNRSEPLRVVGSNLNSVADTGEGSGSKSAISHIST